MPNDLTVPADGSPETPATAAPDTVTNPSREESRGPATGSQEPGTAPTQASGTDPAVVQNGSGDGKTPMAEPPALSDKDARAYATYATCKQLGRPLPPGFTPSKKVLDFHKWKTQAAGDGVPRTENGSGDGVEPSGEAPPAPAAAKTDKPQDGMTRLRAQYATMDPAKVDEIMASDWYLEGQGFSREELVDMKPDVRLKYAVTLKKRDGNMARMAGQASPRQTPPKRPADGSARPTLPANKTAPQAQPKIDVQTDAPADVAMILETLDAAEIETLTQHIAGKIKPTEADQQEEPAAEDAPAFTPQEERLVRGNVKLLQTEALAEFPWLKQPGAENMVAARVKALAERLGVWPSVLTDHDQLKTMYFDAATVVFSREIKGSKTVAAQAAAITAPAVRAPQTRTAQGSRELSRSELVAISARAAREAGTDMKLNDRLFAKYRDEARGL